MSFFAQPDDVLQHHDRRIEHHPHREGETGQGDDVEGPVRHIEHHEGAQQGDGNGDGDQQGRPDAAQEPPENPHRQENAEKQ